MKSGWVEITVLFLMACALVGTVNAQSAYTKHTYKLENSNILPKATIDQVDWLVGNWVGSAFGSSFEEVWNPASAGTMLGAFKLFKGDEVVFYELLILEEEEGSLSLKVKHFSASFHAWEDREDFVNFKLVKLEPNAIHFSGLSFYRDGPDQITGYIVIKGKNGAVTEERLQYRRR